MSPAGHTRLGARLRIPVWRRPVADLAEAEIAARRVALMADMDRLERQCDRVETGEIGSGVKCDREKVHTVLLARDVSRTAADLETGAPGTVAHPLTIRADAAVSRLEALLGVNITARE